MNRRYAAKLSIASFAFFLSVPAQAFDAYGEWRGQVQYIVTKSGQPGPNLQEVVPLVVRVDHDGKVVGTSTENGCRLLGMVSPVANNVMRLDVTFRDCRSPELNRRISGTLAHYPSDRRLAMNLSLIEASVSPVTKYEVTAPMMRR